MLAHLTKGFLMVSSVALLTACHNGGSLSLEHPTTESRAPASVQVYQGGKALITDSGTGATGVRGWIAISNISGTNMTDVNGNKMVLNKAQMVHQ